MGDDGRPIDITCETCYLVMYWWWESDSVVMLQCRRCDKLWRCVRAEDPAFAADGTPLFLIYG